MIIELLDSEGNVFTLVDGVEDPEQEFATVYAPMYGVVAWREYTPAPPVMPTLKQQQLSAINQLYPPILHSLITAKHQAELLGNPTAEIVSRYRETVTEWKNKLSKILKDS